MKASKAKKKFSCINDEFKYFSLLFDLFSEIFIILGWNVKYSRDTQASLTESSIFNPLSKRKKPQYKTRSNFSSDSDYGQYIKSVLSPGMKVRYISRGCLYEYIRTRSIHDLSTEELSEDDIGEFKVGHEHEGLFSWMGKRGSTKWVKWHTVEIIPICDRPSEKGQKESNIHD